MKPAAEPGGRRKVRWFVAAMVTASLCASTCAGIQSERKFTAPVTRNPCEEAAPWQDNLRILQPRTVLRVEAHYIRNTCDGTTQVIGTRVFLRRPEDSSQAALSWMLQCRASRVFVAGADSSPLSTNSRWLPAGWLDIEVKADGENVVVTLSADSIPKNIELFRLATQMAPAH
jgi:hypothetical protein